MRIIFTGIIILFITGCTTTMEYKKKLKITGKEINLKRSELLFEEDFSSGENVLKNWVKVGNASWAVKDGVLEGKWEKNGKLKHGQIFSKKTFQGDILMEFDALAVPPSDHDIIWWWGVKLNKDRENWESGYLGGLGGWWSNKTGVERIEGKEICMAMTPLFRLKPGKKYKIQSGIVDKTVFLFVDGQLIIEFFDSDPLTRTSPGHIGFGLFQSHIKFSNLKVYKAKWDKIETSY